MNADVVFVMDISHSIEDPDLRDVTDFMCSVVNSTHSIGQDNTRFGAVLFGRRAHVAFNLTDHQSKTELLHGIEGIYSQTQEIWRDDGLQPTNIAAGLCGMCNQFNNYTRPPSSVALRIAIVMSDGRSQNLTQYVDCGPWTIVDAAREIHALKPPVLVYVIGVSNDVDKYQLKSIATDTSHYMHVNKFETIKITADDIVYDMCWKGSQQIYSV